MTFLRQQWNRFHAAESGIAYIEFALSITMLLLLFLGSIEITRYLLIVQKIEKIASTIADVTTQTNPSSSPLTSSQMSQLLGAAQDMMNPYTFGANGFIIVTDVTQAGSNNPVINWQYCGGGTLSAVSKIGTRNGNAATLPNNFTMIAGEEVIISEVFYSFTPITTQQVMKASTIYRTSVFMPRLGALTSFASTCP